MGLFSMLCLIPVLAIGANAECSKHLITDLSFKLSGADLAFPCSSTKNIFINSGSYISRNVIVTRMQIWKDDAYVALPKFRHGVPFTLAKFSLKTRGYRATLVPFPCWSMQEEGNCEALQNVVDISIDALDHLWALDIGLVNTLEQPVRRCAPKIVGINLKTKNVVKVIGLEKYITAESRLQHLVVEYTKEGIPMAYIADGGSGAIIVINLRFGDGFRIVLPQAVTSQGKDVLYIQLARKSCGNTLYFTYLSSPRLFSIKTQFLQVGQANGAVVDVGAKPACHKIVLLGTDNGAALFFRYKGESDIYLWNTDSVFKSENFVLVQKGHDCKLATQVVAGYKRLMWAIESNFHDFVVGTSGSLGPSMSVHPLIKTCD